MPLTLTSEKREEIFLFIKKAFSDFKYFDSQATVPLRALIADSTSHEIDFHFAKTLIERYLDLANYQTKEQKEILEKLKIILTAAAVYLSSLRQSLAAQIFTTKQELFDEYPDLMIDLRIDNEADQQELDYLLKFRNFMVLAMKLIPAKGNKLFLLRVIERLEGSNSEYITGTGQKPAVTRRIGIYLKEGDVIIVKKAPKRPKEVIEQELLLKKKLKTTQNSPSGPATNENSEKKTEKKGEEQVEGEHNAKKTIPAIEHLLNIAPEITFEKIFHSVVDKDENEGKLLLNNDDSNIFQVNDQYRGALTEEVLSLRYKGALTEEVLSLMKASR